MASNSSIRIGLLSIEALLARNDDVISQVIFIMDGLEAAPLNIFTKASMTIWQGKQTLLMMVVIVNKKPSSILANRHNRNPSDDCKLHSINIVPNE